MNYPIAINTCRIVASTFSTVYIADYNITYLPCETICIVQLCNISNYYFCSSWACLKLYIVCLIINYFLISLSFRKNTSNSV